MNYNCNATKKVKKTTITLALTFDIFSSNI